MIRILCAVNLLILCTLLIVFPKIDMIKAWTGTVYIESDGSVYPLTAPISRNGSIYTMTGDIYTAAAGIIIERSNTTLDGAGHTIQGNRAYRSRGVDLGGRSNVTVKNVQIEAFAFGVYLEGSSKNRICENNIMNNSDGSYEITAGICLKDSSENIIYKNNIMANTFTGIYLHMSSNNSFLENDIVTNKGLSIFLWSSSNNSMFENNFRNNGEMSLYGSLDNVIFHNNFINDTVSFWLGPLGSLDWNNSIEGNYWSKYSGVDLNSDGIGDSPYEIYFDGQVENIDYYPLMGMFYSFNTSIGYELNVISNSTVQDFHYFESNNTIKMLVSNMTANQTFGFVRICIPHASMNTYQVIIEGGEPYYVNYTLFDNGTHRWIYFNYQHSTLEVIIIREFPSLLILLPLMIATLLAVIAYERRQFSLLKN